MYELEHGKTRERRIYLTQKNASKMPSIEMWKHKFLIESLDNCEDVIGKAGSD